MVSSGSLISADSFSLVHRSAYWLCANSEFGRQEMVLNVYFCEPAAV